MKKLLGIVVLGLLVCNVSFSKEIFGIKLNSNLDDYNVLNLDKKEKLAKITPPTINKDFENYTVSFDKNKKIFMIVAHHQNKFTSQQICMNTLKKYLVILNDKMEAELGLDNKTEKSNQVQYFYGSKAGMLFANSISSTIYCALNNEKYIGVLSLVDNLDLNLSDESEIDTSGLGGNQVNWNQINKDIYLSCEAKEETTVINGERSTTPVTYKSAKALFKITKEKKEIIFYRSKSEKVIYETTAISPQNSYFRIDAKYKKYEPNKSGGFKDTMTILKLNNTEIIEGDYIGKGNNDFIFLNYMGMGGEYIITSNCKITLSKLF